MINNNQVFDEGDSTFVPVYDMGSDDKFEYLDEGDDFSLDNLNRGDSEDDTDEVGTPRFTDEGEW